LITYQVQLQESLLAKKIYVITAQGLEALHQSLLAAPELPELHKNFLIHLAWAEILSAEQILDHLEKYRNRHVLLRKAYLRDETITVAQLLSQAISHIGENIAIRRFVRWGICPDAESAPPSI